MTTRENQTERRLKDSIRKAKGSASVSASAATATTQTPAAAPTAQVERVAPAPSTAGQIPTRRPSPLPSRRVWPD